MNTTTNPFYIAARESGSIRNDLPLWGSRVENPLLLQALQATSQQAVSRIEVAGVPGAFQLLNLLTCEECKAFVDAAETMGFTEDASVSLGRNVRHNMNLNWIVDSATERLIWSRAATRFSDDTTHFWAKEPLGLNQRFRFYRYEKGDFFSMHTDGAWPGSQIINGQPVADAFGDRYSLYTFLIFLNDDFVGGETQFMVDKNDPTRPARKTLDASLKGIRTPAGGALCFPHGTHPLQCLHASEEVTKGKKYIIRTDVLFSL
ncbi:2OG-Fe(II) oxygenase [Neptunomonas sp.]|uniref:2OG-Fe(II) oxygenase n=1 Tax=Neptunomonas sp. TaxID=1971898 RepID=UPI00356B0C61